MRWVLKRYKVVSDSQRWVAMAAPPAVVIGLERAHRFLRSERASGDIGVWPNAHPVVVPIAVLLQVPHGVV
jgi:hypothetical protein